ncbi:MAG: ethylbenzene dehydrogenase-related protein [Magnetococcus sp. THC-1_WYH]
MGRGILALMVMFSAWQGPAMAEEEHGEGHESLNPAKMPEAVTIHVPLLTAAPTMDGQLSEWPGIGGKAVSVPIQPALESDPENHTGNLVVELTTGVFGDRFYVAARWPDNAPDTSFRPWHWRGDFYDQDKKQLDDVFAIRFQLSGDYDDCMLSKKDYRVDVWTWTAGRSMAAGLAEDRFHIISHKHLEDAADFSSPYGTIYIADRLDAGDPIYTKIEHPPKEKQGDKIPSIALTGKASGSIQDVTARGEWKDGFWNLEMSRLLNTGHDDDALLGQGKTIAAATAVFNHSTEEHKSVSGTLNLVFPP